MTDVGLQLMHILMGHLGHAPWCTTCVQARARDDPRERRPVIERLTTSPDAASLVELDYTFIEQLKVLDVAQT